MQCLKFIRINFIDAKTVIIDEDLNYIPDVVVVQIWLKNYLDSLDPK